MNQQSFRRAGSMAAIASFALVVLAACGGGSVGEAEHETVTRVPVMSDAAAQATKEAPAEGAATPGTGEVAATDDGTPAATGETAAAAKTFEIVSQDIFFEPKELTIPANTDVTVTLPNQGVTAHNFSIDQLDISVDLAPGAIGEVVINAPAGTYEFYCNVPGHKEAGMVGVLTVAEEAGAAAPADTAQEATTPAEVPASPAATATSETRAAPDATPAETPSPPAAATTEATSAGAATAVQIAAEPVEIVSYDIYFEPKELTIPANTDVTVALPNDGVTLHNLSIDELGISVDLAPGASGEVVINALAGTYEYYCNVPGHKEAGMVGTLIVSESAAPAAEDAGSAAPDASPESTPATPAASTDATPAGEETTAAQGAAEPVEVVLNDILFELKEITIPANTDVTFALPNEGVAAHNFSIDALNVSVGIPPGATEEVIINAPAGTYEYYCNVPGHKEVGMVGALIVE